MQDPIHTNDDAEDLNEFPAFLTSGKNSEPFEVPACYFDSLGDRICERIELEELAPVFSTIARPIDPEVPAGYFAGLADTIGSAIILDSIRESMQAPADYFEELPAEIENSIRLQQLNISKEVPFITEPDYFDWLPSRIQDRIVENSRPHPAFAWFRQLLQTKYLVPAGFILILLLGVKVFFTPSLSIAGPGHDSDKIILSENEKSEVIDNFELLGFDDGLVNEHLSANLVSASKPAPATNDAVEFLLDNNSELNTTTLEN